MSDCSNSDGDCLLAPAQQRVGELSVKASGRRRCHGEGCQRSMRRLPWRDDIRQGDEPSAKEHHRGCQRQSA